MSLQDGQPVVKRSQVEPVLFHSDFSEEVKTILLRASSFYTSILSESLMNFTTFGHRLNLDDQFVNSKCIINSIKMCSYVYPKQLPCILSVH